MPYLTLNEILDGPDDFDLLAVELKPRARRSSDDERTAEIIKQVNAFYDRHQRAPSPASSDHEEMRLGTIWDLIRKQPHELFADVDRHGLMAVAKTERPQEAEMHRDWRDEPLDDEIPDSLEDIFDEDDGEISEAFLTIKNVTPAIERVFPDHRAEFYPCEDFEPFRKLFDVVQAGLDDGEREASKITSRMVIEPHEGDLFIRKGLLAYIAEKTEQSSRGGKREQRLRVVFSNETESDPLISSFRKALADDPTARVIHRHGLGPLDPGWEADRLDLTGVIYVARSRSDEPALQGDLRILHKIGVTTQDVKRRIADARNDPTFLMAPVDIVATYELHNLSRRKIEDLLHRFFDTARPRDLFVMDRFGKKVRPREWFRVLPQHISQAVEFIRLGTLHEYEYDLGKQEIVRKT